MHLSVNISNKEELKSVLEILKEFITSVEITVKQEEISNTAPLFYPVATDSRGYSEQIPGVTTVSKRGFCKSIPTIGVKGIQFRSRVESKWAYMFENLGWEWTYEPEDSPGYIPDFCLVWGDIEIVVEVKSNSSFAALSERFSGDYQKAEECLRDRYFLLVGGAVWKSDEETLIGLGINPVTKEKFQAFIVGNGVGHWSLKLLGDVEINHSYPQLLTEDIRPTHKTINSMWITASNKSAWKPSIISTHLQ